MALTPYYLKKTDGAYLLLSSGGRLIIGQQVITDDAFIVPIDSRGFIVPAEERVLTAAPVSPTVAGSRQYSVSPEIRGYIVQAESRTFTV